jgi:glyoxylase-like metal-dependent hydrolase (beta-lactamase superfamily II)
MSIRVSSVGDITRFDLARSLAGRGYYWTTCYYVDGLLIDSGCAHSAGDLLSTMEGRPLQCISNTHTHEDHIGANGQLQRLYPGLEIRAHPLGLPVLADPHGEQPLHPYRRLCWGWPQPCSGQPLADGDLLETPQFRFRAIYTPGHSLDHLCLFEETRGWLFSGDLFVGGRDRALRVDCDIWSILASLKKVAALDVALLLPGSARLREDPCPDLQGKIAYYEALGQKVLELYRRGWSEANIVRSVCGGRMWIELVTLGHFSRRGLVRSYLRAAG